MTTKADTIAPPSLAERVFVALPGALVAFSTALLASVSAQRPLPTELLSDVGMSSWGSGVAICAGIAALAAIVSLGAARRAPRVRLGVALALVVCLVADLTVEVLRARDGLDPNGVWGRSPIYLVGMSALAIALLGGLLARRVWGRWLALTTGAVTAATFGLTLAFDPYDGRYRSALDLGTGTIAFAGATLFCAMVGEDMRSYLDRGTPNAWFFGRERIARSLAVVLALHAMSVPMLVFYVPAGSDSCGVASPTHLAAAGLAALLSLGVFLAFRGRSIGLFVCALADLGLLALIGTTWLGRCTDQAIGWTVWWSPAVLGGLGLIAIFRSLLRRVSG